MTAAAERHSTPFLDTIWARLIAAVVAVGGIALFLAVNWDRLVPPQSDRALAGNQEYQQCIAERMDAIAALEAEAGLTRFQAELHQQRADAVCRQQLGL
jgi:hypothetical protein